MKVHEFVDGNESIMVLVHRVDSQSSQPEKWISAVKEFLRNSSGRSAHLLR